MADSPLIEFLDGAGGGLRAAWLVRRRGRILEHWRRSQEIAGGGRRTSCTSKDACLRC